MPQHMRDVEKWKIFLEEITRHQDLIDVTRVTDEEVCFYLKNNVSIKDFRKQLSDPDYLKNNIIHAIKEENHTREEIPDTSSNLVEPPLNTWRDLTGKEVLERILAKDFLDSSNIFSKENTSNHFKDDQDLKILKFNIQLRNKTRAEIQKGIYKTLQLGLSTASPEILANMILQGSDHELIIEEKVEESSDFVKNITVIDEKDNNVTFTFNYGMLLKIVEKLEEGKNKNHPPVIASMNVNHQTQFSISKKYLLEYVFNIFPTGLLFKEEDDALRPMLFRPKENKDEASEKNISLHLILDKSGSMASVWQEHVKAIKNIIEIFTKRNKEWNITFTLFSNISESYSFSHEEKNVLNRIFNKLSDQTTEGMTNLFNTLNIVFNKNTIESKKYENNVILLATDGEDTICHPNYRANQRNSVLKDAKNLVNSNNNIKIFTMGLKGHDEELFEKLSREAGSTHINLRNVEETREFEQYIHLLSNKQIFVDFLREKISNFREPVVSGDITISNYTVDKGEHIKIKCEEENTIYEIATKMSRDKYQQKTDQKVCSAEAKDIENTKFIMGPFTKKITEQREKGRSQSF